MKGSKLTWAVIVVGIALFGLSQIVSGVLLLPWCVEAVNFPHDLQLRRNEIRCAHQGVNSFRVWTREVVVPGFTPYGRPDMEKVERANESDATVHAYPPWHTAFFWFYGWLPWVLCVSLMSVAFGICGCRICNMDYAEGERLSRLLRSRCPCHSHLDI